MIQIIVDAALRSKLLDLKQPLDLCDDSGKVLARLRPVFNAEEFEGLEPPTLNKEEIERRKNSPRWYTSDEVRKHLESL